MDVEVRSLAEWRLSDESELEIIYEICEWERLEYGEGKHRTPDMLYACTKKNKAGFFVALSNGKLLGYTDIWQLKLDFYEFLRTRTIGDESLSEQDILSDNEPPTASWYIGSIMTERDLRKQSPNSTKHIFTQLCNKLPNFFQCNSTFPARLLSLSVSPLGKKLSVKWGFSPIITTPNKNNIQIRVEKIMHAPSDANSLYLTNKK
jgi:hypothetical protein